MKERCLCIFLSNLRTREEIEAHHLQSGKKYSEGKKPLCSEVALKITTDISIE